MQISSKRNKQTSVRIRLWTFIRLPLPRGSSTASPRVRPLELFRSAVNTGCSIRTIFLHCNLINQDAIFSLLFVAVQCCLLASIGEFTYLDEPLQVVVASPKAANLSLPFCSEPLQLLLIPAIHCRSMTMQ